VNSILRRIKQAAQVLALIAVVQVPAYAQQGAVTPQSRYATVNGVKLHYLAAGKGPAVVLLHGYAETSRMWLPLIPELAKTHSVIAPDLRGAGGSDKPETGYDKRQWLRTSTPLFNRWDRSG
jgi:alpha-beta hydrolase superfamily lysophospholipase